MILGVALDHAQDFPGKRELVLLREIAIVTATQTVILLAHGSV